ncbi:hypothetical protein GmHk_04G011073 [Glycine max]|nr:hypothetical protein GmHk_04G011073 [Glycine max]
MARTKKTGEMTTEAAKEIAEKIDSFEEQATQGCFIPRGRQDIFTASIGRLEHPGRVRAVGAGVTIKQYFGLAPRTSRSSSSLPPEELQQLTQQIRDQLEESIIEKVTRQLLAMFSQMQSQFQSQMQSQGLALPSEPLVGPSSPRVSTKESCVDPSGNDLETDDSDRYDLYIKANPACLVALRRVYKGSTVVHNTSLLPSQVKVGVEEVKDPDAPIPVPTNEWDMQFTPFLLGRHIWSSLYHNTYFTLTILCLKLGHLTLFHEQATVSPVKPPQKSDLEVTWDATVFGVFNPDFPLYIKHEDLSEIAHGGQCLSIQHLTETSMRAGNSDLYGFLEPQSIQRFEQSQFETEKLDVEFKTRCLPWSLPEWRTLADGGHRAQGTPSCLVLLDNYLKGIINNALKGLDDAPQSKSKAPARWIVVKYFNDPRPLEPERLKVLRIQWAQYYLRVRAQS